MLWRRERDKWPPLDGNGLQTNKERRPMRKTNVLFSSILVIALVLGLSLQASAADNAKTSKTADIVDTAVAAGSFNTLVTAVKAAGLVDTLKGPGPFTVFAPTDEAFAKLPA